MSDLPAVITPDGVERKLGFNPNQLTRPMAFSARLKTIDIPDFPDSEIVPFDLTTSRSFQVNILDQTTYGACTGFSIAGLIRRAIWQAGYGLLDFSPWFPYSKAAKGVDQGAMLDDIVNFVMKDGICEDRLVPYGTINPRKLTPEAKADAQNWKIEITAALPQNWRQLINCINARWSVYHSIHADNGFNTVNRDGVPLNSPGPHNHAIWSGLGLQKSSRYGFMAKAQNSWSQKWGVNGCAWLMEDNIAGYYGQFIAIVSIKVRRELNPPAAK